MYQARRAYQRIVTPGNRAEDMANTDWQDAVPVAAYHRDLAVIDAATPKMIPSCAPSAGR